MINKYKVVVLFLAGLKSLYLNWKKKYIFYSIVLTLGLIVKIGWIVWVRTEPVSDFEYYQKLAAQIARGGQWGNTYTTVGYSAFLAPFYWLLGSSAWVAKTLNLALSMLSNLLVLSILKKIEVPEVLLRLILVIFIFFPMNIYYNSLVASEILFTALLLVCILLYLSSVKYRYVLIGVVAGLNTMIKPFFPLFAIAIIFSDWLSQEDFLKSIKHGLIILLMTGLTIAPWLYRNYLLIGELTYVSNNGGIVLYINNNSQNKRGGWMPAENVVDSLINKPEYRSANPTERNKMLSRAAKAWITSHPKEFFDLGIKRIKRTFNYFGDKNYGDIFFAFYGSGIPGPLQIKIFQATEKVRKLVFLSGIFSMLFYTGIRFYYLFAPGNKLYRRKRGFAFSSYREEGCTLLLLSFYMFAAVYFLTEGQSRYAFPTVLSLIFYAVCGAAEIGKGIKYSLMKLRG